MQHIDLLSVFPEIIYFSAILIHITLPTDEQQCYEKQLVAVRNDLEKEKLAVAQLHSELKAYKLKHDETQQEVIHLNALKMEQQADIEALQEENHIKQEIIKRYTSENKLTREKLEEERKKTDALVSQVSMFVMLKLHLHVAHPR